jgi:hypothetical protein
MVDGRVDVGVPHHPPQCIGLRSRIREIGAVESPQRVAGRIDVGLNPFSICNMCGAILSGEKEEDGETVSDNKLT